MTSATLYAALALAAPAVPAAAAPATTVPKAGAWPGWRAPQAAATKPGEWPGWRGPNRDGRSTDKGLLKQWPAEGPPLLWKVTDIGKIGSQYSARGDSTRLYDTLVSAITAIRLYAKTLNDAGVRTKCIVAVMTDGLDNDSQDNSAEDVKKLVDACHSSEMFYFVYVGFKSDPNQKLDAEAKAIGFPNVLTSTNSAHDIRESMGLVSQSIIRKSQTVVGPQNSFFAAT
jgi:hypothetical protein